MVRLTDAWLGAGLDFVQLTFHSCTLLPGVTPFVHDSHDRDRFLGWIEAVVARLAEAGAAFSPLAAASQDRRLLAHHSLDFVRS